MLLTIIISVVFIGLLFAGMAVGVILSNKPIKGSCGGLATLGMKDGCEICGGDRGQCEENTRKVNAEKAASLSKDAMKA
ncbi:MAG: (Na+)-NQR maturation NqrM [Alcanivorax sp.]|nr:(Na+)-NQR maturation NqrM [Alcanivorax sp.]